MAALPSRVRICNFGIDANIGKQPSVSRPFVTPRLTMFFSPASGFISSSVNGAPQAWKLTMPESAPNRSVISIVGFAGFY